MFLDLKAFILNLPAESASLIGEGRHLVRGDVEVGHPLEPRGLGMPRDCARFEALDYG